MIKIKTNIDGAQIPCDFCCGETAVLYPDDLLEIKLEYGILGSGELKIVIDDEDGKEFYLAALHNDVDEYTTELCKRKIYYCPICGRKLGGI